MLDLYKRSYFHIFSYVANTALAISVLSSPVLCAAEYVDSAPIVKSNHEFEWVTRYFNSLDDDTPVDEVIDFIVNLRDALEAKGYKVPRLGEFCLKVEEDLKERGIQFDEDIVQELYEKLVDRDVSYINVVPAAGLIESVSSSKFLSVKSSKKKKDDGIKMSEGTAKGFMKLFAGALLCIIPHPLAWGVGGTLISNGIIDMVKHAGDPVAGESVGERIKSLPPPAGKEK